MRNEFNEKEFNEYVNLVRKYGNSCDNCGSKTSNRIHVTDDWASKKGAKVRHYCSTYCLLIGEAKLERVGQTTTIYID